MDELRKLLRDEVFLGIMCLAFLGAGVFGAVNWNSWCYPHPPVKGMFTKQEEYDIQVDRYNRMVQDVGKEAVVSLTLAVPLCVVGFVGAIGFGVAFCIKLEK